MAKKFDHDIWIQETLDQGLNYSTHIAYWPEEDKKVLLKHVNPQLDPNSKKDVEERLLKEAAILEEFWSVYFPKVYDIRRKEGSKDLFILSEYFKGETLDQFITKYPEKALTAKFYLHLYYELKFALDYLHHKKKILHFDLSPDNIIIDLDEGIHIIDFENSKILNREIEANQIRGKEKYLAPELLKNASSYKAVSAIDLYALGKILQEIHEKLSPSEKIKLIGKGPNLNLLTHANQEKRRYEGKSLKINPTPIIALFFVAVSIIFSQKLDSEGPKVVNKTRNYRSPAIPKTSQKKLSDEVSSTRSAPKRKHSPPTPSKSAPISFKKRFLQVISQRDKDLQSCLEAFSNRNLKALRVRYHIKAPKNSLSGLEILAPEDLSNDAKICLTSLYKDLSFPEHKSQKSYSIDQSFTFSPARD